MSILSCAEFAEYPKLPEVNQQGLYAFSIANFFSCTELNKSLTFSSVVFDVAIFVVFNCCLLFIIGGWGGLEPPTTRLTA